MRLSTEIRNLLDENIISLDIAQFLEYWSRGKRHPARERMVQLIRNRSLNPNHLDRILYENGGVQRSPYPHRAIEKMRRLVDDNTAFFITNNLLTIDQIIDKDITYIEVLNKLLKYLDEQHGFSIDELKEVCDMCTQFETSTLNSLSYTLFGSIDGHIHDDVDDSDRFIGGYITRRYNRNPSETTEAACRDLVSFLELLRIREPKMPSFSRIISQLPRDKDFNNISEQIISGRFITAPSLESKEPYDRRAPDVIVAEFGKCLFNAACTPTPDPEAIQKLQKALDHLLQLDIYPNLELLSNIDQSKLDSDSVDKAARLLRSLPAERKTPMQETIYQYLLSTMQEEENALSAVVEEKTEPVNDSEFKGEPDTSSLHAQNSADKLIRHLNQFISDVWSDYEESLHESVRLIRQINKARELRRILSDPAHTPTEKLALFQIAWEEARSENIFSPKRHLTDSLFYSGRFEPGRRLEESIDRVLLQAELLPENIRLAGRR